MATLKISDLSVGDWIQDKNGIYAKVLGIENWSNGYFLNIELHGVNVGVTPLTSAHPIPITAEMLEANGFVKGDDFLHKIDLPDNILLGARRQTDGYIFELKREKRRIGELLVIIRGIRYIHQLQHALRLARVDKEINL